MSRYAKPMSQVLAEMQEAKKITKKERDKLEDDNQHGELALRLAQSFGTPQEVKKIKDINKRHMQQGSIDPKDQAARDKISNKYYKMAEGLDEGYESEVLKVLDDAGIDGYFRNGKLYVDKRDANAAKSALEDADNIMKLPKMVKEEVEDLDERPIDPADVDDDATDADKKSADKNMIMQMRKAMDVKGNMKIEFGDGKKEKVDPKILQLMITAHGKIQKPRDKEKFVAMISKSKRDMLMVAKKIGSLKMGEELKLDEGTWKMPDNPKEVAALKKLMSRPLPIGNTEDEKMYKDSANAKLYGLLGDDELFDALGALEDKGKEKADARPVIIKWFRQRAKDNRYDLGDRTKDLGKQIGLKMEYVPEGLDEKKTVPSILMPMSVEKEIEKMVKDRKYKGNTSALMKDVKKKYSKYYDNVTVQGLLQKHAETNESNRIDNFDENYRKLAMKGIGTETKKGAKVGLKTDYYLPKNGDKSFGKITRVSSSGYEITDEKTKKVYKFKFYDPNNDPTSVRGTKEEVELTEALKPKDKKTIDAFYKGEFMNGFALISDGKKLYSTTQTIATKDGSKFKIVAKMDGRFTQSVVNYIKKTFPKNVVSEEVELDEKYDLYHKSFSDAMQHAYDYAKKKLGITVDPKEIDSKVATGPKKPSEGKTNKYRLKGKGGNLQIQVYNKGGSKPFELNMYKEENEMTKSLKDTIVEMWSEAVSPAQQAAIAISKKEKGEEPKDEGNAFGAALKAAREKGDETFVVAGKTYKCEDYDEKGQVKEFVQADGVKRRVKEGDNRLKANRTETNKNNKSDDGDGLDAVQPKAVKKKFKDRIDKDIDNDGDVDDSDKFLHKRRKAVSKAINNQKESVQRYHETKQGSLRDAVLQMWGEGLKKDEKKDLTKEKKNGTKNMTDTGKEVTPVEMSPKMPKIKETKNKV